uniref:HTH psq-type domain-containing protein n=1 Tax=Timema shepardi TaxID=629360 RepID=A0A7R9G3K8_TIMSH|nr:unnamed protein product [Timema shepardi]
MVSEVYGATGKRLQPAYLQQPSKDTWEANVAGVHGKRQFLDCIGSKDGKHVWITRPDKTSSTHFKRLCSWKCLIMIASWRLLILRSGGSRNFVRPRGTSFVSGQAWIDSRAARQVKAPLSLLCRALESGGQSTCSCVGVHHGQGVSVAPLSLLCQLESGEVHWWSRGRVLLYTQRYTGGREGEFFCTHRGTLVVERESSFVHTEVHWWSRGRVLLYTQRYTGGREGEFFCTHRGTLVVERESSFVHTEVHWWSRGRVLLYTQRYTGGREGEFFCTHRGTLVVERESSFVHTEVHWWSRGRVLLYTQRYTGGREGEFFCTHRGTLVVERESSFVHTEVHWWSRGRVLLYTQRYTGGREGEFFCTHRGTLVVEREIIDSLKQYFPDMDNRQSHSWLLRPFSADDEILKDEDGSAKVEFLGLGEGGVEPGTGVEAGGLEFVPGGWGSLTGVVGMSSVYPCQSQREVLNMPRKYIRISNRQNWSEENMAKAIDEVIQGNMSYKKASFTYDLPQSTLEDRVKKAKIGASVKVAARKDCESQPGPPCEPQPGPSCEPQPGQSCEPQPGQSGLAVTPKKVSYNFSVSPQDVIPIPHCERSVSNRRRGKTAIITSSPYRNELREMQRGPANKQVKRKLLAKPRNLKQEQSRHSSSFDEDKNETPCLLCKEPYSSTNKTDEWVRSFIADVGTALYLPVLSILLFACCCALLVAFYRTTGSVSCQKMERGSSTTKSCEQSTQDGEYNELCAVEAAVRSFAMTSPVMTSHADAHPVVQDSINSQSDLSPSLTLRRTNPLLFQPTLTTIQQKTTFLGHVAGTTAPIASRHQQDHERVLWRHQPSSSPRHAEVEDAGAPLPGTKTASSELVFLHLPYAPPTHQPSAHSTVFVAIIPTRVLFDSCFPVGCHLDRVTISDLVMWNMSESNSSHTASFDVEILRSSSSLSLVTVAGSETKI